MIKHIEINSQQKWWILIAMSTCLALSFLDMTAVAVSLPQIQKLLSGSNLLLQWVVNAYLLTLAVLVIIGGRLGDIYGTRQIFLLGVTLFLFASLICAIAPNMQWLIVGRTIQGIGGALLIPNTSVIMMNTFSGPERGKAMGIYSGSAAVFLALGPLIGGFLTGFVSWRLVFLLNIPLAAISIIVTILAVEKKPIETKIPLDWWGFITSSIAILTLVFAMMEASILGWSSPIILLLFAVCIVSAILFFYIEKHTHSPLINFHIFQNKTYLSCLLALFCIQIAMMTGVFRAIWLQDILDYTPTIAGLLSLPTSAPILIISPLAGKLLDKYDIKLPVLLGFILSGIGMLFTAITLTYQSYWIILPGLFCLGIGIPFIMAPTITAALAAIDTKMLGMGSGVLSAMRQLGNTVGLAMLGVIMFTINYTDTARYLTHNLPQLEPKQIDGLLAGSLPAKQAILGLTTSQTTMLYSAAKAAYTNAFSIASYAATFFLLIGLIVIFLLKKK